jgi:hypothetical protein
MWIQQVMSVCSKLTLKIVKGSAIPPISNALETRSPQNDGPCGAAQLPDASAPPILQIEGAIQHVNPQ